MLNLALADHEWVKLNEWESKKDSWTPTLQVLQYYKSELKSLHGDDVKVVLLCGADILDSFLIPGVWLDQDVTLKQSYLHFK